MFTDIVGYTALMGEDEQRAFELLKKNRGVQRPIIEKKKGRDKAVELASKALKLDGSLAEAHNVLASIYTYIDMDWEGAEKEYQRAIDLNFNYSTVHHYYSEHLSIVGRHQEAREQINIALELDPLSFVIRYVSTKLYFNRGLFNEALTENHRCYELFGDHGWTARYNFEINHQLGNGPAALEGIKRLGTITGRFEAGTLDSIYQTSGLSGLLRHSIEKSDGVYTKAYYYGLLGDDEKAMDMLEKAFDEGELGVGFTFKWAFRNLHSNPRYQRLIRQVGLADI
jgi:tetratricopeptide (TPR) repeat protein